MLCRQLPDSPERTMWPPGSDMTRNRRTVFWITWRKHCLRHKRPRDRVLRPYRQLITEPLISPRPGDNRLSKRYQQARQDNDQGSEKITTKQPGNAWKKRIVSVSLLPTIFFYKKKIKQNTRLLKMMSISAKSPEVLYSSSLRGK